MYTFITGLFIGFVSGYIANFAYNVYKRYRNNNNKTKALIQEIFVSYSDHIVDALFKNIGDKNVDLPNINELVNVSSNIIDISNNYNKDFTIVMRKGIPVIKILNNRCLNDPKFINVFKFLKNNDIEMTLLKNDKPYEIQ